MGQSIVTVFVFAVITAAFLLGYATGKYDKEIFKEDDEEDEIFSEEELGKKACGHCDNCSGTCHNHDHNSSKYGFDTPPFLRPYIPEDRGE